MKKILFSVILSLFVITLAAQSDDVPLPKSLQKSEKSALNKKVKFTVGGGFGLQFGTYTSVSISPVIGIYPAVDWLLIGVGGTYQFTSFNGLSYNDFGVNAFIRGLLWQQRIILHVGYEYMNFDLGYNIYDKKRERFDAHALYLGPGYRQRIGDHVGVYVLLLFNLASSTSDRGVYPFFYPAIGVTFDF